MGEDSAICKRIRQALENLRLRTSKPDALIQLAILGTLAGLMTGLVVISFRLLIETAQSSFLPYGNPENYEGLSLHLRIALPMAGAILIAIIFKFIAKGDFTVGISHVMERLPYHQGYLPVRNVVMQYRGGAIAIISGQSLGP